MKRYKKQSDFDWLIVLIASLCLILFLGAVVLLKRTETVEKKKSQNQQEMVDISNHLHTSIEKKNKAKIEKCKKKKSLAIDGNSKLIKIDLSEQRLYLFVNGKIIGEYRVSTGRPGMRTPTGEFSVLSKEKLHFSRYCGEDRNSGAAPCWMPLSLRIDNKGHYIHELPYWKGRSGKIYKEVKEHLGIPVSHGCVRLGIGPAKIVYDFAKIGTKIIIQE